jgi:hypothetical protein
MFCHSPESWMQMWVEDVFNGEDKDGNDRVKVETELTIAVRVSLVDDSDEDIRILKWSVTRLSVVDLLYICMNRMIEHHTGCKVERVERCNIETY